MLDDLMVRDFRCFRECRVELHPETTFLVGRNAQGKTSLLEAACVLMRLQSPRTGNRGELTRIGAATFVIEGTLWGRRLRCAQSATVRRLAIGGSICTKSAEYLEATARVVWMDHRDMNMLRGGAEHRRRFLDSTASQIYPDYLKALRGYERALRGRNHVLKRDAIISWRQADAFARVMADFATVLTERRRQLVLALQPHLLRAHAGLSSDAERVTAAYAPGFPDDNLADYLTSQRDEESRTRVTAAGPHRDELHLTLNDLDATTFASEGQQRSVALALKLAQALALEAATGHPPMLLLDDVFGELDAERRRALLRLLPSGTQKIITATSVDWMEADPLPGVRYQIERAAATRLLAQ